MTRNEKNAEIFPGYEEDHMYPVMFAGNVIADIIEGAENHPELGQALKLLTEMLNKDTEKTYGSQV